MVASSQVIVPSGCLSGLILPQLQKCFRLCHPHHAQCHQNFHPFDGSSCKKYQLVKKKSNKQFSDSQRRSTICAMSSCSIMGLSSFPQVESIPCHRWKSKMGFQLMMAYRHIPTMTDSHHGGFLSVMIMVGICQVTKSHH